MIALTRRDSAQIEAEDNADDEEYTDDNTYTQRHLRV